MNLTYMFVRDILRLCKQNAIHILIFQVKFKKISKVQKSKIIS